MLEKIKKIFIVLGGIIIAIFSFFVGRRSCVDRSGGNGNTELDTGVSEGIGQCKSGIESANARARNVKEKLGSVGEKLNRAEEILRGATAKREEKI